MLCSLTSSNARLTFVFPVTWNTFCLPWKFIFSDIRSAPVWDSTRCEFVGQYFLKVTVKLFHYLGQHQLDQYKFKSQVLFPYYEGISPKITQTFLPQVSMTSQSDFAQTLARQKKYNFSEKFRNVNESSYRIMFLLQVMQYTFFYKQSEI